MKSFGELMPPAGEPRQANCEKHGAYESRNVFGSIWSKCPACAEDAIAEEKIRNDKARAEAAERRWQEQIGRAGIPERFKSRTLGNYEAENEGQRRALAFSQSYAADFTEVMDTGRGALFIGTPGTGKTHLAVGIAQRIMRQGYTAMFITTLQAIRSIKSAWGKGAEVSETRAIATLTMPDLLILDEVGVQFGSETEKLMLFEILNERYVHRRPSILLSNLTLEEVRNYLGERIMDRLREDGAEVIPFAWDSHRGRSTD